MIFFNTGIYSFGFNKQLEMSLGTFWSYGHEILWFAFNCRDY